jgi:hypothetical protein
MGEFAISSSELRFQFISSNLADETAAVSECKRQPLSGHRQFSLSAPIYIIIRDDRRILCIEDEMRRVLSLCEGTHDRK